MAQRGFITLVGAIGSLRATRSAAEGAEAALRIQGEQAGADELWARVRRLNAAIEMLRGRILGTPLTGVTTLADRLVAYQRQAEATAAKIKAKTDITVQLAQLLRTIDQVLEFISHQAL